MEESFAPSVTEDEVRIRMVLWKLLGVDYNSYNNMTKQYVAELFEKAYIVYEQTDTRIFFSDLLMAITDDSGNGVK